jgi:hypothetical protein
MDNNKPKHGGSRLNSGAKKKYNETTTTITFRVPCSKVSELKELVKDKLKEYLT